MGGPAHPGPLRSQRSHAHSSSGLSPSAVYCIGNFALMLLSLLETIIVMHLLERDHAPPSVPSRDQALGLEKESSSIFPNFQGGETRNLEKPSSRKTMVFHPVWEFGVTFIRFSTVSRGDQLEPADA